MKREPTHRFEAQIRETGLGWRVKIHDTRAIGWGSFEFEKSYTRIYHAVRAIDKMFEEDFQQPRLDITPTTRQGARELDRWTGRLKKKPVNRRRR